MTGAYSVWLKIFTIIRTDIGNKTIKEFIKFREISTINGASGADFTRTDHISQCVKQGNNNI